MARNYAALPWDYLVEMELLTDAEFGRLCRALLKYSSTGEMEELNGNERVLFPRVKMQEDRFQASYEELSNSRSESGKKGAAKRWNKSESEDSKNIKAKFANGKNSKAIPANSKNGNTETKTETETINRSYGDGLTRARAQEAASGPVSAVVSDYLDRINPAASRTCLEDLAWFAEELGEAVCKRAFDIALDNKKTTWPYIRAILQDKQSRGINCLADWDAADQKRKKGSDPAQDNLPSDDIARMIAESKRSS